MTSWRGRRGVLTALALSAALVLAGCGGGGGGSGEGEGAGDLSGAEAEGGNDINPMDPAMLQDGGTFVWNLDSLPPNFNRIHLDGTEADNRDVMESMMPQILKGNADGELIPDPNYLVSAEVTGENPQVITYQLNPDAVWYDDRQIDWTDFQAQWQALNGTNEAFVVAGTTGYENVASVEQGASPQEVVVTFTENYGDWRSLFTPLFPRETNLDPAVFNEGWIEQPLTTAGPFKFESIDRTAQSVTVVRNEKWWGETPRLDTIVFQATPTDAAPEAFANGTLTFFDIGPSVAFFQRAQQVPDADIRVANGPNYRHITFQGGPGSILEDPALRLAIMKGIDRQVITESQIGPIIPDAAPLGNHIYVEGTAYYEDNAGVVAYDPEAAAAELDELGWVLEGDVRMKDGQPLALRDVIPSGVPTSDAESRIVQQQLAAIGVQVNIEVVPSDGFFEDFVNTANFDITHFSWLGTQTPLGSSSGIYRLDEANVAQNYGRIGNDAINTLIDQANAELDPDAAGALANELDQAIWDAGHSLLLYQRPDAIAVQSNVANFGARGFSDVDYTMIGFIAE